MSLAVFDHQNLKLYPETLRPLKNERFISILYYWIFYKRANTFEVQFQTYFKVQGKNRKARIDAFNSLKLELSNNLKKITNEIYQ